MSAKRVAVVLSIILWGAGLAMGQTVWDPVPGIPVLEPGPPGSWDDGGRGVEEVVLVDGTYHMIFLGWSTDPQAGGGRGHATSIDGVDWAMDPMNPVLPVGGPGDWDAYFWGPGVGVVHDGVQFHMWYTAASSATDGSTVRGGYATSADGSVWTKNPANPVLVVGPPGSWDDYYTSPGAAILEGDVFKLWYNGHNGSFDQIGYAESLDGITWTKHPDPVLRTVSPGPWDAWVFSPSVVLDGSVYHMWYAGYDRAGGDWMIGYAFSLDGIHDWTRPLSYPVISDPGTDIIGLPVVFDGSTWHGWWIHDSAGQLNLYATSSCCSSLFEDGFETGDTSWWSTTVP